MCLIIQMVTSSSSKHSSSKSLDATASPSPSPSPSQRVTVTGEHRDTMMRWMYLAISSFLVALASLIILVSPSYTPLCIGRGMQGLASAVVWTYCLSLCATLEPKTHQPPPHPHDSTTLATVTTSTTSSTVTAVSGSDDGNNSSNEKMKTKGMDAIALVLASSCVGEIAGPWMGTIFWEVFGDLGLSYLPIIIIAALNGILAVIVAMLERGPQTASVASTTSSAATTSTSKRSNDLTIVTSNDRNDTTVDLPSVPPSLFDVIHYAPHRLAITFWMDQNDNSHNYDTKHVSSASSWSSQLQQHPHHASYDRVAGFSPPASPVTPIPPSRLVVDTHQSSVMIAQASSPSSAAATKVRPKMGRSRWAPITFLLCNGSFMQLSMSLLISSLPRTMLDLLIPLTLDTQYEASTVTIGIVFGCASGCYVISSIGAGRYIPGAKRPMITAIITALLMSVVVSLILVMTDIYALTLFFCLFATLLVFSNIIVCNQLEQLAARLLIEHGDTLISDRVMAISCLWWTAGFAIGSFVGGLPSSVSGQQWLLIGTAIGNAVYHLMLLPRYGITWSSLFDCCRHRHPASNHVPQTQSPQHGHDHQVVTPPTSVPSSPT
jgi:hypothetical protein